MFAPTEQPAMPPAQLRTMQVLTASLAMSVLAFIVVFALLPAPSPAAADPQSSREAAPSPITWIAWAVALLALPAGPWLGRRFADTAARRWTRHTLENTPAPAGDPDARHRYRHTVIQGLIRIATLRILVGPALHEAAGIFLAVSYYLDRHAVSPALGGVMILGILAQIPTPHRLSQWLEEQVRNLDHPA